MEIKVDGKTLQECKLKDLRDVAVAVSDELRRRREENANKPPVVERKTDIPAEE